MNPADQSEPPAQSLPQGTKAVDALLEYRDEYEAELQRCESFIQQFELEKDLCAVNFHQGKQSGLVHSDIFLTKLKASLAALQRENEKLREQLKDARGPIYYYSNRQEQFLTDKERNTNGEFGPEWQPVEEIDNAKRVAQFENRLKIVRDDRKTLRSSLATKDAQIAAAREYGLSAEAHVADLVAETDALRAELSALIAESMSISEGCESRIAALKTECERLKKEVDQARASLRAFVKLAKDHHAKITANNKALTARAEAAEKARDRWMSACDITAGERDAALALVETCRKALDKIANDERVGPWQSNPGLNERHIAKNVLASLPVAGTDKRTTPDRSNWTQDDAEEAKLP